MKTDDGDLYNPDNYGCRRRALGMLVTAAALVVGLCSLGWWIA